MIFCCMMFKDPVGIFGVWGYTALAIFCVYIDRIERNTNCVSELAFPHTSISPSRLLKHEPVSFLRFRVVISYIAYICYSIPCCLPPPCCLVLITPNYLSTPKPTLPSLQQRSSHLDMSKTNPISQSFSTTCASVARASGFLRPRPGD